RPRPWPESTLPRTSSESTRQPCRGEACLALATTIDGQRQRATQASPLRISVHIFATAQRGGECRDQHHHQGEDEGDVHPGHERPGDEVREVGPGRQLRGPTWGELRQRRSEQRLDRVVAEEGGEEGPHR